MSLWLISPFVKKSVRTRQAFTLIEMMTAMAILTVIMIMMGQVLGTVNQAWSEGRKKVNNFTKARAMLDMFARDIQAGLFRDDLAFFPNSEIAFYTKQRGILPDGELARDISLVHYVFNTELDSSIGVSTLQRRNLAISWNNSAGALISFGNKTTLPNLSQTLQQDVAPGVIGYKALFVYADGTVSPSYRVNTENPLRALGLTLAVVDDQTLQQINVTKVQELRSALESSVTENRGVKADWEDYLDTKMPWKSYPKNFGSGLEIFERYVNLPSY